MYTGWNKGKLSPIGLREWSAFRTRSHRGPYGGRGGACSSPYSYVYPYQYGIIADDKNDGWLYTVQQEHRSAKNIMYSVHYSVEKCKWGRVHENFHSFTSRQITYQMSRLAMRALLPVKRRQILSTFSTLKLTSECNDVWQIQSLSLSHSIWNSTSVELYVIPTTNLTSWFILASPQDIRR